MATISSVRSVRWCAVVQGTERFRLSRKYIYCLWPQQFFKIEPSSKLLCLFILWIHRNWLDRNCLFRVHTVTESGFRFETETGFDKWITPWDWEINSIKMSSISSRKTLQGRYCGLWAIPTAIFIQLIFTLADEFVRASLGVAWRGQSDGRHDRPWLTVCQASSPRSGSFYEYCRNGLHRHLRLQFSAVTTGSDLSDWLCPPTSLRGRLAGDLVGRLGLAVDGDGGRHRSRPLARSRGRRGTRRRCIRPDRTLCPVHPSFRRSPSPLSSSSPWRQRTTRQSGFHAESSSGCTVQATVFSR